MKSGSAISRVGLFYAGITIFALMIVWKLFVVQVVQGEEYSAQADRQYVANISGIFNRGSIFFTERDGKKLSAATLRSGYTIAINPTNLGDIPETYGHLSEILILDEEEFLAKANKEGDPYEEITKRASKEDADAIDALGLDGVLVIKDHWRFYPAESMASHTLGFVGYKGDELAGRYGLERFYNDVLSRNDTSLYVNFFAEVFSNLSSTLLSATNSREGDLAISIEPTVQGFLETRLSQVADEFNAESGGGVIIDPTTGKIYGMASLPDFDPNFFNKEENQDVFQNPIIEKVYEMGSIIKPLTMAAGLDAGVVKPTTLYTDEGYVFLNQSRIENYDGKARGVVSMQEVLNQSLNTGAVFVMRELGKDKFRDYMLSYGIGRESGIDLPNEVVGLVDNLQSTRDIEYATASFGQGIAMTPIETVRALATLANGGELITPHVGTRILYDDGLYQNLVPPEPVRVLKKETSEEISRMLTKVVDDALLGGTVALPNYSIAAKTGTAQMALEDGRGYYDDKFLHSFFGYFPAYDPQFLVFLYIVDPRGIRYASQTLTHPFMDITKFLINYYEIEPDR